jgi:hypothetical protein
MRSIEKCGRLPEGFWVENAGDMVILKPEVSVLILVFAAAPAHGGLQRASM